MKTELLPSLLFLYGLLVTGLALLSWFIHRTVGSHLTKLIFNFWLINVINLFINAGASSSSSMFLSMLAIAPWPFMLYIFMDMMREFSPSMPTAPKSFYWVPAIGYTVTLILSLTTDWSLTWVSSPAIYCFGYLGLGICWISYKNMPPKQKPKSNTLQTLALLLMLSFILHMLDWPFVRMNEHWVMLGYTYFLFNLIGFAAIFPALGLKQASVIREKELEKLVNDKTQQLLHQSKFSALGEMAAGVAHEINNPLSIISGRLELMDRKISSSSLDRDSLRQDLKQIENTTFRIAKIVKGLKDFSQTTDGLGFEESTIGEILNDVLIFCVERFKLHNIKLMVEGDLNYKVRTRGPQLSQVFLNLLNNSFDAIENVETKWIKIVVSPSPNPGNIRVDVIDSGNPISQEIKDRIMEPFFTTKEVGKGTGLGLPVSKGIIEGHGGKLFLDSSREHTTFVLELPTIKT